LIPGLPPFYSTVTFRNTENHRNSQLLLAWLFGLEVIRKNTHVSVYVYIRMPVTHPLALSSVIVPHNNQNKGQLWACPCSLLWDIVGRYDAHFTSSLETFVSILWKRIKNSFQQNNKSEMDTRLWNASRKRDLIRCSACI